MTKFYSLLLIFLTALTSAKAQTYYTLNSASNGQTYTIGCGSNSVFRDDGPTSTHYSNNENYTISFCSSNGNLLKFNFGCADCYTVSRIHPSDTLYIYDGIGTAGILLAKVTGNPLNSNKIDYFFGGGGSNRSFLSLSSCITFRFVSDGSNNEDGWEMGISCVAPVSCNGNAPASDLFGGAPFICNLNGYCGQSSANYDQDFPANLTDAGGSCPGPLFGGTIENNSWLKFEADSSTVNFTFNVTNCSVGIQVAVFDYSGNTFTRMSPCNYSDGGQLGTFTLSATGLTTGRIYYLMTDGNAGDVCDFSVFVSSGVAVIQAGADQSCCAGNPVTLSASGPSGANYIWNSLDGVLVNASGATQIVNPLVSTTYVVSVSGSGVCSAQTDTVHVTVTSTGNATINPVAPLCADGAVVTLSAATTGGSWSGNGITNATTGDFSPSTAGAGDHVITYTLGGSCGGMDTLLLYVINPSDAQIQSPLNYCVSDTAVTLIAQDNGGIWSGTGITDSLSGLFDPSVAGAGTFEIIYSIPGICGNSDTASLHVTSSANAAITAAGPFCSNDAVYTLMAAEGGGIWSGTGISDSVTGTFDPALAGTGTHQITYTIGGSCGDTSSTTITVNPAASAQINPAGPYCSNHDIVSLSAVQSGGIWSGNGITDANTGSFDPGLAGAGTHSIFYTISGSCGDTDTLQMLIHSAPIASITGSDESCLGANDGNALAAASGGTEPYTYDWNNGLSGTQADMLAPGIYIVQVADQAGCSDTASIEIKASLSECEVYPPSIFVPNIFSPNGDQVNDVLYVRGNGIKSFTLKIYDRWGEKVFETSDLAIGWDCSYRDKPMNGAVFVYTLYAEFENGTIYTKNGNITIAN
jgi:gliding motility-associated-like protein